MRGRILQGHLITLFTVCIWGVTFVSTKVLLKNMSPLAILFCRFLIGYVALFALYPKVHRTKELKEELLFFALGLTGVFLYFTFENTALQFTMATNVGLLSGTVPILTAIVAHFLTNDERFSSKLFWGFIVAFTGTALVIFNAQVVMKLNPLGDFLAMLAPLTWSFYSVLLKRVDQSYNPIFVTRKTFFYGLITVMPLMLGFHTSFKFLNSLNLELVLNIAFLGLVASAICFVTWNKAVEIIGTIKSSNYIYLIPLITMVTSVLVLHEKPGGLAIAGGLLILAGVYISERGFAIEQVKKVISKQD